MPRFGKGKPMAEQAQGLLKKYLALSSRHTAKQQQQIRGSQSTGQIHSLRTFQKYTGCLKQAGEWAKNTYGLRHLDAITPSQAQTYLEHRANEGLSQKQLDADRQALSFLVGKDSLQRVLSSVKPSRRGRAYLGAQVALIASHQTPRYALSTRIAYEAGLRAHELYTLRRAEEAKPSGHRQWDPKRFQGREGVRYVVTGKGGLKREVLLSTYTAQQLEARRLDTPQPVTDRGIHYQSYYAIAGGVRWTVSFSKASKRALGWSRGAHGLRHRYAQERLEELQQRRMNYYVAREVISQELGHFRGDVVETYLR